MNDSTSYVQRFQLDELDIRGAIVQLDEVWQALLENRDYPAVVRDLLGEMCAVACVIGRNLKQPGRLTFQISGHGPVSLLVRTASTAQSIAQLRDTVREATPRPPRMSPANSASPTWSATASYC